MNHLSIKLFRFSGLLFSTGYLQYSNIVVWCDLLIYLKMKEECSSVGRIEDHVAGALRLFAEAGDLSSITNRPIFDIREGGEGRHSFARDLQAVLPVDSTNPLVQAIIEYERGDETVFARVAQELLKVGVDLELRREEIGGVPVVTEVVLKARGDMFEDLGISP